MGDTCYTHTERRDDYLGQILSPLLAPIFSTHGLSLYPVLPLPVPFINPFS